MPRLRRLAPLLALLLCAGLAPAARAARNPTTKKAIWGPATPAAFATYHDLGAGIYETALSWRGVAPTRPAHPRDPADPAYRWPARLDEAVALAKARHMRVAVELTASPRWANGRKPWNWAPKKPKDFANFAYAASKRYPSIHLWLIWGEPSRKANFQPLYPEHRRHNDHAAAKMGRKQKIAPHNYARILDGAYGALHAASRRNVVIGGDTFITGDISPYNWIRNLRLPNGRPPRMDMYGHNPFTLRPPVRHGAPLDHGFADFSTLWRLEGWIDRYLKGRKAGPRKLKLFLAEFTLPTDHRNHEFNFWVDRPLAAKWLKAALKIVRHTPRLYTLGWLSLYDEAPRKDHLESDKGLLTITGKRKPAYFAFKRG